MNSSGKTQLPEEKTYFPLLIRLGNKNQFSLVEHPSKLPMGEAFVVWSTNSSQKELDLANRAYAAGYSACENMDIRD